MGLYQKLNHQRMIQPHFIVRSALDFGRVLRLLGAKQSSAQ
jgi:hypothetical protein